jgi:hypothetical protein
MTPDLLTDLREERAKHRTFQDAEWAVCCTCGARNFASHKDGDPPCRMARALDCAIALAEALADDATCTRNGALAAGLAAWRTR